MRIFWNLSLCLLLFAGCGSSDSGGGGTTISSQPLSGKIGGQAWTFRTGETTYSLSDTNAFFTTLYASTFAACETLTPPDDAGAIIIQLPTTPGSYDMSLSKNATFYVPPSDNWVATRGHVEVYDVTATTITGGANFAYNSDNTIDGQFTASICP